MHFNFDMRTVRDDNLSILPTLPFNHACGLTLYYFHCLYACTEACFMFHQLKWKHIKRLWAELMNGKYLIESPGSFWTDWKLVFTRGAIQIVTPGPHILDKIDWKCFIRQWLLVADLQTNISHRKHFRILPSFVIPRDWNLNGSVWIKNDPEFIISVIYCRCCFSTKFW